MIIKLKHFMQQNALPFWKKGKHKKWNKGHTFSQNTRAETYFAKDKHDNYSLKAIKIFSKKILELSDAMRRR